MRIYAGKSHERDHGRGLVRGTRALRTQVGLWSPISSEHPDYPAYP
jgi:hypothetical protein